MYDPQSPLSPKGFWSNGSSTKELALVANEAEARILSQATRVDEAGVILRSAQKAAVVVIKRGHRGASVFTDSGVTRIPAYRTRSAFLIGSGDIFSAEFAYRWLMENCNPEKAAEFASLAVAYYSQNPSLPVARTLPNNFKPDVISVDENKQRVVYLAGPFFNMSQLWMVEETFSQLSSHGLKVFSPFHEIGVGKPEEVVRQDIDAIAKGDGLFALLDGYDAGTLFEIGFARALNKPVTILITSKDRANLAMLVGTGCDVFHDFASAVNWEASR